MKRDATHPDLTVYHRFLGEIGVDTLALWELFAEEIRRLPDEDLVALQGFDLTDAAAMTAPQRAVLTKVLARAAVKAKRRTATT